jgi:hypothetical protein
MLWARPTLGVCFLSQPFQCAATEALNALQQEQQEQQEQQQATTRTQISNFKHQ